MIKKIYFDTLPSTNTYAKEKGKDGAPEGTVIIAGKQTGGRGRRGRNFHSPENGLYFSVILRPCCKAEDALFITTCAAVAVVEGIKKATGKDTGIKWVNDIFYNGKKICGILTEADADLNGNLNFAVLGIGINIAKPEGGFADDIKDIAGALFEESDSDLNEKILDSVLESFFFYYENIDKKEFIPKYKEYSVILGKEIEVHSPQGVRRVEAIDIDDECHLVVLENGIRKELSSGEISVRF